MISRKSVLAFVMAGGKGSRLEPLTNDRAKPAVPFGGKYRIIDFVLSNLINSGIFKIYVLTQFKSQSLTEHLQEAWNFGNILPGHFIIPVPAQQRTGEAWYQGTADAIYQNINLIDDHLPDMTAIFGGDHIYVMNVEHMLTYAMQNEAEVCVACIPVPIGEAHQFGVIQVDENMRITGFQEKPKNPTCIPGQPDTALCSMGNYVFQTWRLMAALHEDAEDPNSAHDFGKNVLPRLLSQGARMYAYDFRRNVIPGGTEEKDDTYWRDVGTLDSYFEASMDLRAVHPALDLYNPQWPIRTAHVNLPPAKFVHNVEGRVGQAVQSIVGEGTIISGATVIDSVVGMQCRFNSFAEVDQCVIMDGVNIGRGAKVRRAIIDKHVNVPPGARIGFDAEADKRRFSITPNGIVVIAKNQKIEP